MTTDLQFALIAGGVALAGLVAAIGIAVLLMVLSGRHGR